MGTYRKNKKREKRSTRKRGIKGGNIYGIIPIVSYNNVGIEPVIDKDEYIRKNHVYPEFDERFDINNVFTNVQDFFRLSDANNTPPIKTRKIKIAMHTDKELREMNVLNKMIRAINNSINPILRQDKNKTNLEVLRSIGNPKIKFHALYGLTPKERIIAEKLMMSGIFEKALYYSPLKPKNQDTRPDYVIENERLKKINNELNEKLRLPIQYLIDADRLEAEKKEEEKKEAEKKEDADRLAKEEAVKKEEEDRLAKEEAVKKEEEYRLAKEEAEKKEADRLAKEEEDKKIKVGDLVTFTNKVSPDNGKEAKLIKIDGNEYTIQFTDNNEKRETSLNYLTKK